MTSSWAADRLQTEIAEAHARHAKRLARIEAEKLAGPARKSRGAKAAERRALAITLRGAGLTYREIGERMGFGTARAAQLCRRPIETQAGLEIPARELISRFLAARGSSVPPAEITAAMLADVYWPDVELFDKKATLRWAEAIWFWMRQQGTLPLPFDPARTPRV